MNREEPPEMKKAALDQWVREQENCGELGQREIRQIQLQKLNALLKREKGRQGFYRNLPEHLASLEQLPELPLTAEEDLKRSGNGMVLVSQSAVERVRTQETSGTTGPAKRVFYTAGDNERTVSFFAAGLSELIHPGSRTMICMPFSGDRGLGELIAEAVTRLGAEPLPGGWDRTFGAFLDLLEKEQPDTFVGPPVLLLSLLRLQPESSLKRALVSGDACPAGVMCAVIDKGFGGVIFHEACGHSLEATAVAFGNSEFAGKLGQQIASPIVTAIDDGTMENEWGSINIDDEGNPATRLVLIENGILKNYMMDRLNGRRMGMPVTGSARRQNYAYAPTSRMRNTFIAPGNDDEAEIISSMGDGLYAKAMGGGSVNPITGEFNFAVSEGYLVKGGKIDRPVRGATLIGKGADILKKIDRVGKTLELGQGMCGSVSGSIPVNVGQPMIRVTDITVGGR